MHIISRVVGLFSALQISITDLVMRQTLQTAESNSYPITLNANVIICIVEFAFTFVLFRAPFHWGPSS